MTGERYFSDDSGFETLSAPASLAATLRGFTFCVAAPAAPLADDSDKISSALRFGVLPQLWVTKKTRDKYPHYNLSHIEHFHIAAPYLPCLGAPGLIF